MTEITGKVVEIKSPYSVVINRGHDNGVEEGMRFVIYEKGEELKDPDTDESLGNFEYVIAKVKVNYVREKYSVAETYENETIDLGPLLGMASVATDFYKPRTITSRIALPLDNKIQNQLSGEGRELVVNKGDLVRQIID
jgi:hypothetical protein